MGLVSLLISVALARPLELVPTPGAVVTALPRTSTEIAEIGVYENRTSLRHQVAGWTAPGLQRVEVVDVTGGITFVVLHLARPELVAQVVAQPDGRFEIRIQKGDPDIATEPFVPTIDELVMGIPRHPLPIPEGRLLPLTGDARTYDLPPSWFLLDVPKLELEAPEGWEDDLAAVSHPGWDDVARWRHVMGTVRDADVRAVAAWRLGGAYARLDLPRESTYYFGRTAERIDDAAVHLAQADGALRTGNWDVARDACAAAAEEGPEAEVLTCLGVLSLASSDPSPAETGRALARVADRPQSKLLAGELLLRDGYAEEAIPLLASARHDLEGEWREVASMALGDAWLVAGDVDEARSAYLTAPHVVHGDLLRVRELLVRMLSDGIRSWPSFVPELSGFADHGAGAGADALYLLGQIHARYSDLEAEAATYARLWDLDPDTHRSNVPRRLLDACAGRVHQLERDGRDAELVSAWKACWRDGLQEHVVDTTPLASASRAWERLGFPEHALALQIDLTQVLAGFGLEDPLALARLAELQIATGVADQALETLTYARSHVRSEGEHAALDVVLGSAHAALGAPDLALAAWDRAATDPIVGTGARERAALLRLKVGRCAEAAPLVSALIAEHPMAGQPAGEVELQVARCEVSLDRPEAAIAAAHLAWTRATDAWSKRDAAWLATAVAERTGAVLPEELKSDAPTFELLRAEDQRQETWTEEITAWKKGSGG